MNIDDLTKKDIWSDKFLNNLIEKSETMKSSDIVSVDLDYGQIKTIIKYLILSNIDTHLSLKNVYDGIKLRNMGMRWVFDGA